MCGLAWVCISDQVIASVLPHCPHLQELSLRNNNLEDLTCKILLSSCGTDLSASGGNRGAAATRATPEVDSSDPFGTGFMEARRGLTQQQSGSFMTMPLPRRSSSSHLTKQKSLNHFNALRILLHLDGNPMSAALREKYYTVLRFTFLSDEI